MASDSTITLSFPDPDIAMLTLDLPGKGTNVLSRSVLEELSDHLDELEGRGDLAGLVVTSGKQGQFIAGADLREFSASLDIPASKTMEFCDAGQTLFSRLSSGQLISVAAIDGICVGGGAELAMWCDRRVMSDNPKTQFGFPEVKLGLIPGWGGTARAPRMVGLSNAIEMITGGESISAAEAYAMGWANDLVPADRLLPAAIGVIRCELETQEYLADRQRWSGPLDISDTELGFLGAAASALIQQHTKGQYPAPLAALETMLGAAGVDVKTACQMEAETMSGLFGTPINASLLNIFFLMDRNKKDPGTDAEVEPATIKSATVYGAGIMGAGIAAANVKRNIRVAITDTRPEALDDGVRNVLNEVSFNRATKSKDMERAAQYAPLINGTTSIGELAASDLVLEAVIENPEIKKELYKSVEPHMRRDAILATNTSTIPISQLARDLEHPDRFCGIHFFNPVRKMKLVEVIRGDQTNDATVATAVKYAKRLGKMPVVVNDGPGFLVNRLLMPYMNEALVLISEGAEIKHIEKAATSFGMPMGPFALYDMVGLDTALYGGEVLCNAFPDRFSGSPIIPALVEAKRLGQKSGSGFFAYSGKKKKGKPDPALTPLISPYIADASHAPPKRQLADRLFLPMLVEAIRILEEKLVRSPRDIDLGMIFGTGFPPFKGGPMFWADTLGAEKLVEMLEPYQSLGERFQPNEMLLQMAKDGTKFYEAELETV